MHSLPHLLAGMALVLGLLAPAAVSANSAAAAPAPGGGQTFVVPPSIDATGVTDVSDQLNDWLARETTDGRPLTPNRIVLRGIFRVEYGLTLGSSGRDPLHPGVDWYTRNYVELDLTQAALIQTDATPYSVAPELERVTEPRRRWGAPLLTVYRGEGVKVRGGALLGSNRFGRYSWFREPWHGVEVVGTAGLQLVGLRIEDVWGDFVYLNHWGRHPARNVVLAGGRYDGNGRQGITMNSVAGLEIAGVEFRDVQRMLFDHEPGRNGGLTDLDIHDSWGDSGRLGFVNFRSIESTPFGNITIRNHRLEQGHFRINVDNGGVQRQGFTLTNNASEADGPYDRAAPLIQVGGPNGGFDGVTIQHNRDVGANTSAALWISPLSTRVVTTPNDFPGFW
jgi:hypothetical protein